VELFAYESSFAFEVVVRVALILARDIGASCECCVVFLAIQTRVLTVCGVTGMHSGPVTAGVLRGERSRFQLFGDTMNTASRVETTGKPGRIHLSQETADLIIAAGKGHWVHKREDKVVAKGKGEMQTYWLDSKSGLNGVSEHSIGAPSVHSPTLGAGHVHAMGKLTSAALNVAKVDLLLSEKSARLIDWNVDVLMKLLKQIVTRRAESGKDGIAKNDIKLVRENGATVLDEVQEIIELPAFNAAMQSQHLNIPMEDVVLPEEASSQLFDYVLTIATLYRENPFHNFDHASHVVMSVVKLMSRIVAPSVVPLQGRNAASKLHDHTYGITSDPLTQFACVFSALIHDVDHTGVPNSQLIKENSKIASLYKNKSVAEQNSVDLAWDLLMEDSYSDLRSCIYATESEMKRFRQLVVNSVMATDIMDKDLKTLRNNRWDKAFQESLADAEEARKNQDRKATIVIEHLIQASDVSHTMQHWHVYRKWNERLFKEMYAAFLCGRADRNPAEFWFQGEIGFFDFYIIPLARKLKECGVFGVSSDEYLTYAIKNRKEWEARGKEIVSEMMQKVGAPERDMSE
jgi:3'5'-cyclic nucleotide phosphodiesterase/Adenylate and Guanylate cyclase catalytic domain